MTSRFLNVSFSSECFRFYIKAWLINLWIWPTTPERQDTQEKTTRWSSWLPSSKEWSTTCFPLKVIFRKCWLPYSFAWYSYSASQIKSKEKRVSKERFKFLADLSGFSERTTKRAWRLITGDTNGAQRKTSEWQTIIDNNEEEKSEGHSAEQ